MTPSEKPESEQPQQDATDRTSVSTQTVDDSAGTGAGEAGSSAAQSGEGGETPTTTAAGTADAAAAAGATAATDAPPPWQRAAAANGGEGAPEASMDPPLVTGTAAAFATQARPLGTEDTQNIPKQVQDQPTVRTKMQPQQSARSAVSFSGTGSTATTTGRGAPTASARRPSRGPRRASLQIKRLDPWSVLKLALVLSVALFFVWMIAVAVLYGVLDGMGVWEQLNGTFTELTQPDDAASEPLISAGRVFGVASIIGAINIVLVTALATVGAFIYNVAADFAGGVEVTLSERE